MLAALERWTTRARIVWTAIAVSTTVISLGGPLSGSGVAAADRSALAAAHLFVAALYIPLMRRTIASQSGADR